MTTSPTVCCLLAAVATLTACGDQDPVQQSHDGKIRIVQRVETRGTEDHGKAAIAAALGRFEKVDVIFAHDYATARSAQEACEGASRENVKVIGVGRLDATRRAQLEKGRIAALVDRPTHAAAAVDIALLAANGLELPRTVELGTTLFTRADVAAGGRPIPAAGDIWLASQRHMQKAKLTTTPSTDENFRVGFVDDGDESSWGIALRAELEAAARRYPQIEYHCRTPGEGKSTADVVRSYTAEGFHCILREPGEDAELTKACQEALAAENRVILLGAKGASDAATCCLGTSEERIGAGAAECVRELIGKGEGAILEVLAALDSPADAERRAGFAKLLGLK